jgi:hypothetical protein
MYVDSGRTSLKFVDLLTNNKILPSQWKFFIPLFIVQQPLPVVVNAKNLSDGIERAIQLYNVRIPDHLLATYDGSPDYLIE